ncbi:MAG: GyrI-like domain-containing protein [Alphaproteobacteria bacterium]|nr:GyrI-like domain-containing protein [Alphaproteobacteria bacterium]
MDYAVTLSTVAAQPIAAVRAASAIKDIPATFKPALDQVWAYLNSHAGVRAIGGHNLFFYHHPPDRDQLMDIDFGVQVARYFDDGGAVRYVETPAGQVAKTLHVGPYSGLRQAHQAVHQWCEQNSKLIGGHSWELYGDWNADESKLETEIFYLLR